MGKKNKKRDEVVEKQPPTPESENGPEEEETFEVEKVVDKRIHKGRVEYLLKWKSYSSDENTWEPEDSLDCPELLEQYEREKAREKADVKKEKKEKRKESSRYAKIDRESQILSLLGTRLWWGFRDAMWCNLHQSFSFFHIFRWRFKSYEIL